MQDQRRREADYSRHQAQLRATERRHEQRLAQQRRAQQQRYMRDYHRRLQQQHLVWQSHGYRDTNAWYGAPLSHRYYRDGRYHQVSRYAANLLQQAVDLGYREGRRAGGADSDDGWRADYRNSYAYEDASYGYNGWYVDQDEYGHYFREGFRRGYDDGYYDRSRYGRRGDDGDYLILAAVLTTILVLQQIH
jgi:hypothetical protein